MGKGLAKLTARYRRIKWETWEDEYRPLVNHLDPKASGNGFMFETYGPELEFVRSQPQDRIWTLIDDGRGRLSITDGFHFVNRLGYFVTEVPVPAESQVDVMY